MMANLHRVRSTFFKVILIMALIYFIFPFLSDSWLHRSAFVRLANTRRETLENFALKFLETFSDISGSGFEEELKGNVKKIQSYNLENFKKLQLNSVPPELRIQSSSKMFNKPLPLLWSIADGRLGNIMGEYATLLGLHLQYNASVLLHPKMRDALARHFPNITMEHLPKDPKGINFTNVNNWKTLYNYKLYHLAASGLLGSKVFQLRGYPFEMELFSKYRQEIRREFTFSKDVKFKAETFLREAFSARIMRSEGNSLDLKDVIFVGIHARLTDYERHMNKLFNGKLPNYESYFKKAIHYFEEKYKNIIFIASSDDKKYIENILKNYTNVFISPKENSAVEDLALLTSCNHSIMTVGSYGFWSGFLAGGEVAYSTVSTENAYRFTGPFFEEANLTQFIPISS